MMEGSIPSSSSLSTPTPTPTTSSSSPAAPSVFRPRRSEDWNKYRATIESLYRDDQLKLRDVKRIMERDHKFVASEKQYKDRLAAWNIRKNIKAKEVNVMIRKQAKRAARGKQTVFRVAGQKVDTKRIARFQRRYQNGTSWDAGHETPGRPVEPHRESPEPATPSDMSYYTPEPDERATTLSPHPESHSHHSENSVAFLSGGRTSQGIPVNQRNRAVDTLDPIQDSEQDDTNSMTLSPSNTSTYAAEFPDVRYSVTEEGALSRFQKRLMLLDQRLEQDTAHLFPLEEPTRYSSKPDNTFLS